MLYAKICPTCRKAMIALFRKSGETCAECLACHWIGKQHELILEESEHVEMKSAESRVEQAAAALQQQLFWQGDGRALRYIKEALQQFADEQHAASIPADVPRYWVMRYNLTNEKSSAEVSHKDDAVCVVMVDELSATRKTADATLQAIPFVPDPQNDAIEVATILNISERVIRVIMKADFAVTVEVMRCEMGRYEWSMETIHVGEDELIAIGDALRARRAKRNREDAAEEAERGEGSN